MLFLLLLASADVKVMVKAANPVLLEGRKQITYVKIGIEGLAPPKDRAPVNLSVVIDQSGSMSGDKIESAKDAAMMVVDRLGENDILSVIAYDSSVTTVWPAGKVRNPEAIKSRIRALYPRGSTALFAGVSSGLYEVRRYLEAEHVNRVILLSDGQANVGPSSPNELGRLGVSAAKEGISITTIGLGLGYNEDLMSQLAMKSDGNHAFAENASDLSRLFNAELGDVLSVVAHAFEVRIRFAPGVRPLRAMNRECEIRGDTAIFRLNQVYAKQEKYVLFEVDVDAATGERDLLQLEYNGKNKLDAPRLRFVTSAAEVDKAIDRDVMVAVSESTALERNKLALDLRDQGKIKEARETLQKNSVYLEEQSKRYASPKLRDLGTRQQQDAKTVDNEKDWASTRKKMRKEQVEIMNQQSY